MSPPSPSASPNAARSIWRWGARQRVEPAQQRLQQPVQARVGQLGLGLDTRRPQDPEAALARGGAGGVEEHRLTDPRLPAQHERAAALGHDVEVAAQLRELGSAAHEAMLDGSSRSRIITVRDANARGPAISLTHDD